MHRILPIIGILSVLGMLAGCAGHQKGVDTGIGFDALNTQSKEDKENEKRGEMIHDILMGVDLAKKNAANSQHT